MALGNGYDVFTLEPSGVADVAFSADQTLLYAAMKNGDVEVFDVASHQKIATWHVGTSLGALSLTPDGTGILLVERQPAAGMSTLYRVDTASGLATAYSQAGGTSFYDIEVVDSHTALLTGGGQNKNSLFNLDSNSFGALSGGVYYSNGRSALVEDQHLTLLSEAGISNGPMYIFDDRTHSFVAYGDDYQTLSATGNGYSTGFNWGNNAISEAAGKVVQFIYYGSLLVYDLNLKLVGGVSIGAPVDGLTFDVTGSYLYGYFPDSGVVKKFDTSSWAVVATVPVGTMANDSNGLTYNDQLLVDSAGHNFVTLQPVSSGFYSSEGKLSLTTVSAAYLAGATSGDDVIAGGANPDSLAGGDGNDTLYGREANDTLDGGNGQDTLYGEDGNDILIGGAGADTLDGGNGSDLLFSAAATPGVSSTYYPTGISVDTTAEHDVLKGGAGDDYIFAGYGDDVDGGTQDYIGDKLSISFMGATSGVTADFRLLATQASITIGGGTITGIEEVSSIEGSNYDDFLAPYASNGYADGGPIYGRGGNDHIVGDYYTGIRGGVYGGDGDDVIDMRGSQYSQFNYGEAGDDYIIGGSGYETLSGGDGNDRIEGNYGFDTLLGGDGNDVLDGGSFGDTLDGGNGNDLLYGAGDADVLKGGAGDDVIYGDQSPLGSGNALSPSSNDDDLRGEDGNDTLYGDWGNDKLDGGAGDDLLDGGTGNDAMTGGTGNDVYVVDAAGDTVTEKPGEGTDEVRTALTAYALPANVENLTYTGAAAATLRGNALDNFISGGPQGDTFQLWDGGHDHAVGGGGYDIFSFGGAFDAGDLVEGGDGIDEVHIQGAYGTITLGANLSRVESVNFYGHAWQGEGNPGASPYNYNVVVGTVSTDENMYYIGAVLGADETLTVDGSGASMRLGLTGGDGNDVLTGSAYDDWIYGGLGADTMTGGAGSDTYTVDNVGDAIVEKPGEGEDTVSVSLANYTLPDNVEDIIGFNIDQHLTGNAADNKIYSGTGNDVIDGGVGADRMAGSSGNDIYYVDNAGDTVIENPGEGSDEVRTTLSTYTLAANVENLTGLSNTGQILNGNALDNVIKGGTGADTMAGGAGDDIYYVDSLSDIVVENAGEGMDEVRTTLSSYVLPANVEKLTYIGTGNFAYTGNAGNDDVTGGGGNDFLDLSQGGADVAALGAGNDAVYFGAAFGTGDRVDGGAGADTVILDGVYTGANRVVVGAGQLADIETLTLASGGAGSPSGYDIVWQDGNLGTGQQLLVYAGALGANENVTFDGSAEAHGYFIVYGGAGTDDVKGGAGSDGFYFGPGKFSQADHVDGGGGGQNQIGLDGSYDFSATGLGTLGGNFTNIQTIILYTGDPQDTANPYPNHYHIVTNDAAVATGQTLTIYGVQLASDLTFDGSAETNGAFRILAGAGNDTITGGQGNDILYGNGGAGTLTGGGGNDVFVYADTAQSSGASIDHITDFGAGDRIDLSQIDADTIQGGDQAFAFIGAAAFDHHAGELRAELSNGVWTIEGDTNGDGNADFTILVATTAGHAIVNTDFVLQAALSGSFERALTGLRGKLFA